MNYRPRRRRRSHGRRKQSKNWIPLIMLLLLAGLILWTLITLVGMLFSGERSELESAELTIQKGKVEVLLPEAENWTPTLTEQKFFEAEKIRTGKNTKASLEIMGANTVYLDENTQLNLLKLEQKGSGRKTIHLELIEGQIWTKVSSDDFNNDDKSAFSVDSKYLTINVKGTAFNLQSSQIQDSIRLLKGSVDVVIKAGEENSKSISLGVGQKLIGSGDSFEKVQNNQDILERLEDEFMESEWNLGNFEKFYPQDAAQIRRKIEVEAERQAAIKRREEKTEAEAEELETNSSIPAPTITKPGNGEVISASTDSLLVEGTAPDQAYQIVVNGYTLTKFEAGAKKWQYFASKKYGTIVPGENTYTVYAVNRAGEKSQSASIKITYEGTAVAPEATPEPTPTETAPTSIGSPDFTAPVVTRPAIFQISPNETYQTSASVVTFSGTVDPKTNGIEVNGFRLKKFQPGDTKFAYIANANYGNMKEGENVYTIKALGPDGKTSQTAIKIVYTPLDLNK